MWNRVDLKTNAKEILQRNYWWAVLVALILGIAGNGASANIVNKISNQSNSTEVIREGNLNSLSDMKEFFDYYDAEVPSKFTIAGRDKLSTLVTTFVYVLLVIMIISILLSTFLFAPLEIGCKKWFIKNRTEKPQINEVVSVFSNGYLNAVKIMFLRGLYTGLWSLLFVIPGIVKAYEYRLIPYLLAENPNMDMHEAFERSKNMMNGNKWNAFVLDLSFIGWALLAGMTCGILGLFWVNPYIHITDTELYVALCQTTGSRNNNYGNHNQYSKHGGYEERDYRYQSGIDPDLFN